MSGTRQHLPVVSSLQYLEKQARDLTSMSLYAYVDNRPTVSIDPDGRELVIQSATKSEFTKKVITQLRKLAPRLKVQHVSAAETRIDTGITLRPHYQKGTRLIKALAASNYKVEIRELNPDEMEKDRKTGKRTPPYSMTDSKIMGRRIVVHYSPDKVWETRVWKNREARITEWERLPKHIELGHELVHALHHVLGTYGRAYPTKVKYVDVSGRARTEPVSGEESQTVGMGKYQRPRGPYGITENVLRQETAKRPGAGCASDQPA